MKNSLVLATVAVAVVLAVSACDSVTVQGVTERAIATKEIATATLQAICSRPENDIVRTDIRAALAKISTADSRQICTEGLDKYLTEVVFGRIQGEAKVEVTVE